MSKTELVTSAREMGVCIERMIQEAEEFICIVSPYLKMDGNIRRLLEDKSSLTDVRIHLIYREGELTKQTREWFDSVPGINTYFLEDLHAKCYLNEKEALVTSMNLYDHSMANNVEMGVLVTKGGFWGGDPRDETLYQGILNHAIWIKDKGQDRSVSAAAKSTAQISRPSSIGKEGARTTRALGAVPTKGCCIRCGVSINIDPVRPFCKDHWRYWIRHNNVDRELQFCHICTNDFPTTRRKPACKDCWKKYKDILEFPAA